jgi:phenylacetate-CoA ligase
METARRHKDLQNPHYQQWLAFLQSSGAWSAEEIRAYQWQQTKDIVTHAYEQTVGYRVGFDASGFHPQQLQTWEDFSRVPFFAKATLRDHLRDFSIANPGGSYVTTGGSTGIPMGFYRDDQAFGRELASKAFQYHRIGWCEGDPQLVLRGTVIDTPDHMQFCEEYNELRCSAYFLTEEFMPKYYEAAVK